MDDQTRKAASFPLSSILMILVALGVVVFTKTPLKDVRPAVPEMKERTDQVRARLWQDPYRAVLDQVPPSQEKPPQGAPKEAQAGSFTLERLAPRITNSGTETVTILGVMVFGGPYIDESEHRIRMRYAVLAGLRRLGYYPQNPDYLDYVRTYGSDSDPLTFKNILPFEWMETRRTKAVKEEDKKKTDKVLVLWINEDVMQKDPLEKLSAGLAELKKSGNQKLAFKLIGPAGSNALINLFQELKAKGEYQRSNNRQEPAIEIYSPGATVDISLMDEFKKMQESFKRPVFTAKYKNSIIRFERTIGTDSELAQQLIRELTLREVNMIQQNCAGSEGTVGAGGYCDHLVLISEWDTFYGRMLPSTFRTAAARRSGATRTAVEGWIHRFNYLRGMDGALPGDLQKSDKASDQQARGLDLQTNTANLEQAMGRSQYDYLRRLADSVYRLDLDLRQKNAGRVKAVGILGSDFYDKYLVLQAMKQRFPDIVYFTTDMDARLLQQDHLLWTRNMIVASSYGLELPYKMDKEGSMTKDNLLQGEVPPFRDSYQTSVYLSTMLAFDARYRKALKYAQPKIFEIGRQRAHDLSVTGISESKLLGGSHAPGKIAFLFAAAAVLLTLSSSKVRRFNRECFTLMKENPAAAAIMTLIIIVLSCIYYWRVYSDPDQEPFSLLGGISIWPTEILRLFAAVLSIFMILKANRDLTGNFKTIDRDFGFSIWAADLWKQRDKDRFKVCYQEKCSGSMEEHWLSYATMSAPFPSRVRICGYIAACFALGGALMWTFGTPTTPVRGELSWKLDKVALFISISCMMYLTFLAVDASRLCRDFIRTASSSTPPWIVGGWTDEDEWKTLRLIAKRTEAVGKLIFYPLIVWFVLFVSRLRFFDNWVTPLQLAALISLPALYAWSCAFRLRKAAESARAKAVERLTAKMVELRTGPQTDAQRQRADKVRFIIDEVAGIKQGAFASYMQSPVLQALLVPFGGVGGITLLDMFTKMDL